jgi:hypothetical protein
MERLLIEPLASSHDRTVLAKQILSDCSSGD